MHELVVQLGPTLLVQVILAFVIFALYRSLGRNPWPPSLMTLIPGVGVVIFAVYQVRVLFHIVRRIEALEVVRPR